MSRSTSERPQFGVHPLVVAGWTIVGLMFLATSQVRWVESGPGSTFGGLELADNLRNGVLVPDWGDWVALGLYSIIGLGGVFVATSAVAHQGLVVTRLVVILVLLIPMLLVATSSGFPVSRWAAGPILVTTALIGGALLSTVQLRNT